MLKRFIIQLPTNYSETFLKNMSIIVKFIFTDKNSKLFFLKN